MSIICAAIKNNEVSISCDSQTNFGSIKVSAIHQEQAKKIYKINSSIVGIAGWVAISNMFEHLIEHDKDLFQFDNRLDIYSTLIKLHEKIKNDYFLETKEDDDQPVESSQLNAIIINKNGIFEIGSYREVNEYRTFWAIGSGRRFGLGAMHAVYDNGFTAQEITEAGVKAATEFCNSCGLPIATEVIKMKE